MKSLFLFFLIFQLITGFVHANTALITLDNSFTWKAMFDAGFRPIHVRDGIDKCRQLNVRLQIRKQEGSEILDLGIGDVEFSLRDEHLLELFVFYGREYRTVAEVERKSEIFARIFGDAVTKKSEIEWFETKHSVYYGLKQKHDPPIVIREVNDEKASNHARIGDLSLFYRFRSVNIKATPMAERFSLSLESPQVYKTPLLKTKIQPPAGYEHISLEPKTDKSPKTPNSSDPENSTASSRPEKIRPATDNNPINTNSKKSAPFPWWLIVSSVAILALALAALLKIRKSKSTP